MVERVLWEHEAIGSNPVSPTMQEQKSNSDGCILAIVLIVFALWAHAADKDIKQLEQRIQQLEQKR